LYPAGITHFAVTGAGMTGGQHEKEDFKKKGAFQRPL